MTATVAARPAVSNPWAAFLARRLGRLLVSLAVLVTLAFVMIHLIPGDPVRAALGVTAPPDLVEARREALGLNDPLPVQYVDYVRALFSGDLGVSMTSGVPVSETIGERLPATASWRSLAFVVVMLAAIPLGLAMAVLTRGGRRRGTELGFTSTSAVVAAIPEFLLAVGLVFVFGVHARLVPGGRARRRVVVRAAGAGAGARAGAAAGPHRPGRDARGAGRGLRPHRPGQAAAAAAGVPAPRAARTR